MEISWYVTTWCMTPYGDFFFWWCSAAGWCICSNGNAKGKPIFVLPDGALALSLKQLPTCPLSASLHVNILPLMHFLYELNFPCEWRDNYDSSCTNGQSVGMRLGTLRGDSPPFRLLRLSCFIVSPLFAGALQLPGNSLLITLAPFLFVNNLYENEIRLARSRAKSNPRSLVKLVWFLFVLMGDGRKPGASSQHSNKSKPR